MSRPGHREPARRSLAWRTVVLNLGATLGTLCIIAAIAGTVLGVTPLVFRSGSMAPAIETGALALSRTVPAEELRVDDVVSVLSASGVRITHRIQSVEVEHGRATLVLKGDANQVPDAEPYVVASAERVLFDVPKAGYAVSMVSSRIVTFLGGLLVGGALLLAFTGRGESHAGAGGRRRATSRRSQTKGSAPTRRRTAARPANTGVKHRMVTMGAVAVVVAGAVVGIPHPVGTLAAWSDTATVTGSLTADTLTVQSNLVGCATQGDGVRLTWTSQDTFAASRYKHRVTLTVGANSADLTPDVAAGTSHRDVMPSDVEGAGGGLLGGLLGSSTNVTVTLRATAGTTWISGGDPATRTIVYREGSWLLGETTVRCS